MGLFKLFTVLFSSPEKKLGVFLRWHGLSVSTAESCTGGLVSSLLTDVSGSSEYVFENIVTYSNTAKTKYLDVNPDTLSEYGAVSEQTAKEMAVGLKNQTKTDYTLATTGIAGPTGESPGKPIGLMYIGIYGKETVEVKKILAPRWLPRTVMKKYFAKIALIELYKLIEKDF